MVIQIKVLRYWPSFESLSPLALAPEELLPKRRSGRRSNKPDST